MTKTQTKHKAQDYLLDAMEIAFYAVADDGEHSAEDVDIISIEIRNQLNRARKIFGYDPLIQW